MTLLQRIGLIVLIVALVLLAPAQPITLLPAVALAIVLANGWPT